MIDSNWNFHYAIAAAAHNRNIEKMYTGLLTENLRIARLAMAYVCYGSVSDYRAHLDAILREHRGMVTAIDKRDANIADEPAVSHANLARIRVTSYLGNSLASSLDMTGGNRRET